MASLSVIRDLYLKLLFDGDLTRDLKKARTICIDYIKKSGIDDDDRKVMLNNLKEIQTINKLYDYLCNSMLVFEHRPYFYRIAGCPFKRLHNICNDGKSEWDQ